MFSLYSLSPRSSSAFSCEAVEEPPVHDGGGRLRGQRLQGVDLLAVERVEAVLSAHPEHRDHLPLHAAGEEPGEAAGRDVGALDGRGVDVHGLAERQPRDERAVGGDPGAPLAGAGHAPGAERREVAALAGQQEGQLAQAERRPHALEQPLARPLEVEVRVEVLGEAHERLARAVALLVEEPVERLLDPRLDRREEQRHHEGAQEHDEARVRLLPQHVGHADGQEREPHDHRHRQHVAERAAEDELDVHQAVLDHRVGERERDERERPVARELQREPGLAAEGEGQRVEGQEGEDTRRGAPEQPLHLPPRGEPARAPVGVEQDREGEGEEDREVERLRPGRAPPRCPTGPRAPRPRRRARGSWRWPRRRRGPACRARGRATRAGRAGAAPGR